MTTPEQIATARIVYVPDGYFPSGRSRPRRAVRVENIQGRYVVGRYLDTGERIRFPAYAATLTAGN